MAQQVANEPWTVGRILKWTTNYLKEKGDEHPRLSAEWLLNNATGLSRVEIYMHFDQVLSQEELARMHKAVVRRAKGEPLQYVTGEMPFRHIVLKCEQGVLIPRPETEVLVDAALEGVDAAVAQGNVYSDAEQRRSARQKAETRATPQIRDASSTTGDASSIREAEEQPVGRALSSFVGDSSHDATSADDTSEEHIDPIVHVDGPEQSHKYEWVPGPEDNQSEAIATQEADAAAEEARNEEASKKIPAGPRVLEIGCGTGCIDLSIASERPGTFVVTTDLSPKAVALAKRNRAALGLDDKVEILQGDLATGVNPEFMGTFAVLVSNPPYIPSDVIPTLPQEVVGFEPGLALDGGPDGLDVFRRILALAPQALAPGGMLCCELFETNVQTAAELTKAQGGWQNVEVREDLTHRPRVLVAVRS